MKIIEIDGIKYQLTLIQQESKPQTLYDVVKEWVDDPVCLTVDNLIKKVEQWLPEEIKDDSGLCEWDVGYNCYREQLLEKG